MRLGAYEEMKKQFTSSGSESDGCFRPFVDNPGIYKKIVTDSNVVAQETGVSSLCAFLEFGGTNACLRTRGTVVAPLIEKGLASTRAGTRQNAVDALLWYIELDTPDPVIEDLVPFLTHRMPKLVAATTNALTEIFRAFGAKTVSPKPVMKSIPKLFAHADKNVRAEANNLVIELYKWTGDAISKTILPELKPVQQKELEEQFSKVGGETPHQQRYLKSQQEAMDRQRLNGIEDNGGAGSGINDNDEEMEDADPMDLIEPEDVLSKAPQDLADRLSSAKWKDRKEALDELYAAVNKPKIQNDDFSEIVRLLAKCLKDANIQVVMVAANCIQCLADGLRQGFARHQQTLLSPVLERTKEKKTNVSEALNSALDSLYKCNDLSLTEILEPTLEYLKHKTPQIKIETAKFLVRCLSTTKTCPKPPEVKQIVEASQKLLGDTQEPVRSGGAEILGVLMKMFGERAMNPHLESVDDIKKANIQKFCESATVKAKPEKAKAAPAAAKPPPTSAKKPPGSQQRQLNRSDSTRSSGIARARPQPPQAGGTRGPGNAAVPEQVISKKRLASPIKTPRPARERQPPSELSHETFAEPPPPQPSLTAPTPRAGLTNRGLTGRSLTNAPTKASTPPQPDNSEIQALKQELEQLRGEKSEWQKEKEKIQWQAQEDQAEKSRLMQEINDLQLKNAQLVEDHTRDILQIKSKETQLVRATSDVDTAKLRINKLESEVDRLQQLLDQNGATTNTTNMNNNNNDGSTSQLRSLSTSRRSSTTAYNTNHNPSSPKSPSMTLQFGLEPRSANHHRTGGAAHSTSSIRRSIDFGGAGDRSSLYNNPSFYPRHSSLTEDKENFGSALRNVQAREEAEAHASTSSVDWKSRTVSLTMTRMATLI